MHLAPLPVTLRQLQYVVAVADTKSFRRAAELCRVSQPSLSAQIAEVERGLGVKLFERDRRGVLTTDAGRDVIERARRTLLEIDDLVEATNRHRDPLSGMLRLGVIPTIGQYLLPAIVPKLKRKFPKLVLAWTEDKTEVLVEMLKRGELEAALLAHTAAIEELEHVVLFEDPFVLALPANHPLASSDKPVRTKDIEGERMLLLDEGHCLRDQALEYCSRAGVEELGFRATSLGTLVQMVAGGAGITVLPSLAVGAESKRADIVARPFAKPAPSRTIVLAFRKRTPFEPALRKLAAAV